jgi:hypothetical protein
MVFSEITAVCWENHVENVNALSGQNAEFWSLQQVERYSNDWD